MEDKLYECPNCGKESKESEFVSRRRDMVHCPECGQLFVIGEDEAPPKRKRSHRKKIDDAIL